MGCAVQQASFIVKASGGFCWSSAGVKPELKVTFSEFLILFSSQCLHWLLRITTRGCEVKWNAHLASTSTPSTTTTTPHSSPSTCVPFLSISWDTACNYSWFGSLKCTQLCGGMTFASASLDQITFQYQSIHSTANYEWFNLLLLLSLSHSWIIFKSQTFMEGPEFKLIVTHTHTRRRLGF